MSGPTVQVSAPPRHLFQFPPSSHPETLPPPTGDRFLAAPFTISPPVYNNLLSVYYPAAFVLIYVTAVTVLNQINRKRDYKPWGFSKTLVFQCLVVVHSVLLAIISGWTFLGMVAALSHSWPGWHNENGTAALVDSMCKINGPRGLGDATTYNPSTQLWEVTNKAINLGVSGTPDTTDLGRIWNEGLAFWGWLFYFTKAYEVLNTAIILMKGKKSSMLQTYHHAGAILCIWAGIRYMAPPIWIFVLFNSGIHALMYTYYTLSALSIRVPQAVKRTITTMQIAQFVVGTLFAVACLFISYSVPVSTPYTFVHNLSVATSSISSVAAEAATAVASGSIGSILKKLAFRAAAQEGLAENVRNSEGQTFGSDATHAAQDEKAREETRYRTQYQTIQCLDTSGQAFAIYLNVIYLLPLTWLFVNSLIRSYRSRMSDSEKKAPVGHSLKESSKDALKDLKNEMKGAVREKEGDYLETDGTEGSQKLHDFVDAAKQKGGDWVDAAKDKGDELAGAAKEKGGEFAQTAKTKGGEAAEITKEKGGELADAAKKNGGNLANTAKTKGGEAADYLQEKAGDATHAASDKTQDIANAFTAKTGEVARAVRGKNEEDKEEAKKRPDEGMADKIHELAEALKANIGDIDEKNEDAAGEKKPKKEADSEAKPARDEKDDSKADTDKAAANKAKGEGDKSKIPQAKRDSSRKPDAKKDEAGRPQSSRSSSSKNTSRKSEAKNKQTPKKEDGEEHHPDEEFELHNGEKPDEMLPQTRPNSTEDGANGA
ncbi:MAG: hypothetical protein M1812_002166 [Candelaria pacifica]|nr:MAG: hypothetical protein M1812_002166 [Candelaria pacifica]